MLDLGPPPGPGLAPTERTVRQHGEDTVFFVVQPATALASGIVAFAVEERRRYQLDGKPRPARVLHVSLNHIGAYSSLPPEVIARAGQAASTVAMAPFDLTFDRLQSFRSEKRRPVVLLCGEGLAQLTALRAAIGEALARQRLPPGFDTRAVPHMTLLYDSRSFADVVLEAPIVMPVTDFVLVRNLYGKAEYEELGRWPLRR
ncbi:2'-5' RNA ligase family protein [Phreatobacter stygius]|uniref:2'-5' RNA ligase family protein n=1 Tax=Phreatobacter stygius TaxID=1940610 RepID=UPI001476D1F5|nr:2'-5' RNA ligase family protein [Phreatobacter stygius]